MNRNTIEKAVAVTNAQLRKSNQALRRNLKRLVECSTENEKAQERMDAFEALIFEAESLDGALGSMITQGRRIFEIQFITVALGESFGPSDATDGAKTGRSVSMEAKNVLFAPVEKIATHFPAPLGVTLRGNLREGNPFFFPGGIEKKIRSEALVPLRGSDGGLYGALCFGSAAPDRFLEGYGVRFLERLGRLVSLKMEVFRGDSAPASE